MYLYYFDICIKITFIFGVTLNKANDVINQNQ